MIGPGQVFFLHMILMDSDSETAMCLGRTSLVGEHGAEPLNVPDLDLVVAGRTPWSVAMLHCGPVRCSALTRLL